MARIQFRRGTAAEWNDQNPVLALGEPGFEIDTGRMKIGDEVSHWSVLDYVPTGPEDDTLLQNHILSAHPHVAYDENGPSFILLYLNAKV